MQPMQTTGLVTAFAAGTLTTSCCRAAPSMNLCAALMQSHVPSLLTSCLLSDRGHTQLLMFLQMHV